MPLGQHQLDTVNVQPRTFHDFYAEVERPLQADIEPGNVMATLNVPLIVVARYGRRAIVSEMPAGPFSAARAKTKRHRRRWP